MIAPEQIFCSQISTLHIVVIDVACTLQVVSSIDDQQREIRWKEIRKHERGRIGQRAEQQRGNTQGRCLYKTAHFLLGASICRVEGNMTPCLVCLSHHTLNDRRKKVILQTRYDQGHDGELLFLHCGHIPELLHRLANGLLRFRIDVASMIDHPRDGGDGQSCLLGYIGNGYFLGIQSEASTMERSALHAASLEKKPGNETSAHWASVTTTSPSDARPAATNAMAMR